MYFSEHDTLSIEAAKKLIDTNIKLHYTIPKIALEVGLNERKLKEGFRQFHEMGLYAYLKKRRLEVARKMLEEDPDRSVKATARFVGYKYPDNLTSAFKKEFHITPKQLIKNIRLGKKDRK